MTEKIIDEVMDLVDAYAAMQGVDTYDQQVDAHDAIRAKLREVLERKVPSYSDVVDLWNKHADEHNQWDALGEDEKIVWAVKCAIGAE